MKEDDIPILGVCRFSMLGRGDWKAYRKKSDDELEGIYEVKAKELFEPARIEARLATFKHLTLRSLLCQSDTRFKLMVVAADRMPEIYQAQLAEICSGIEQVILRFVPPMHVSDAIRSISAEESIDLPDTMQFRLDDDDCVAKDYVRRLRRHSAGMWRNANFGVSFPSEYYSVLDGETEGIYNWFSPFFSAGACIRHSSKTIFDYAHYQIPARLVAVTDPHFPNIVTHRGDNDTPRHPPEILRKRGMRLAPMADIQRAYERHFDYLTPEGLALCRFDKVVTPLPAAAQ